MRLHDLKPNPGSTHARKRVGRGPGSGHGTTAGRGMNGQKSRSNVLNLDLKVDRHLYTESSLTRKVLRTLTEKNLLLLMLQSLKKFLMPEAK